jgi:DNA-3-methyladenine glycosylase II
MSLRRSARVASSTNSTPAVPISMKSDTKYTKVAKKPRTSTVPKKRKTKASATDETIPSPIQPSFAVPSLPATPLPDKRKAAPQDFEPLIQPPPFTPTPAGATFTSPSDHPFDTLALHPHPAGPHITNVALATPNGSRVVAYASSPTKPSDPSPVKKRKAREIVAPDVGAAVTATSSSETLLEDAEAFLISVDPKLKGLVQRHKCKIFTPEGLAEVVDPFTALASGIIGQQVRLQLPASYLFISLPRQVTELITGNRSPVPLQHPFARNSPHSSKTHLLGSRPQHKCSPRTCPRCVPRASRSVRQSTFLG